MYIRRHDVPNRLHCPSLLSAFIVHPAARKNASKTETMANNSLKCKPFSYYYK
ncbi:hypothetical protein TGS27_1377 [Geobacillus stearothermophilus]|uniref:Uncharacterized protein n=1 Tax=Geobacillus stearothermophilus TaxID=1422 RepID=A0A150MA49_GEOSE|nr:hypothetical protein GS8_349 [Geobacillus stearothermophilus]KYD21306.1 hypothetical protein B4109_0852 [Geobacillus stearothermophilus]OAO82275.1 hypothetical protein TGS27_1377 [Geobacillus stearothermophilus]